MTKKPRLPQAPSTPMPELAEFLGQFRVHFNRRESQHASERYLTGLLTEHPNKNCDTLATVVPNTTEQRLQGLLTTMVWDENDLNRQRVQVMCALHTERDGVIDFDDTGFAKQGKCSVGVARQYSGTLGKVASCKSPSIVPMRNARWRGRLPRDCICPTSGRVIPCVASARTFPMRYAFKPKWRLPLRSWIKRMPGACGISAS